MPIIDPKTDMRYGLSIRDIDGQVFDDDGRKVIGWMYCDDCGEPVTVRLNAGKKPYYGCKECNNQHKPQSMISRKHFEDRMEKIKVEVQTNDNTSQTSTEETNQPSEAEASGESPGERNESDGDRARGNSETGGKPKLNIGCFPVRG